VCVHTNEVLQPHSSVHFSGPGMYSRSHLTAIAFLLCILGCSSEETYVTRAPQADGGTGRFYMGREIADVMSSEHGALWLDRPERNEEELPTRLLRALDLNASDLVADIGAGTGFFSFRLAQLVPSGRVYSVEVQQALVDTLAARSSRMGIRNVVPVLGVSDNPNLPEGKVDLALIVSSYHEFSYPFEMLDHIRRSLSPGGRLAIVEYRTEDSTIRIPEAHRMSREQIIQEGEAVGLRFRETLDVLPQQHIVVFNLPAE